MPHQNAPISTAPSHLDIVPSHKKVILSYQCAKPYAQYMASNVLPKLENTVMIVLGEVAPSTMWSLFDWMKGGQYIGDQSYDRYVRHSRHVRQRDLAQWIDRADIVCLTNSQNRLTYAPLAHAIAEADDTQVVYADDMGETIRDQVKAWAQLLGVRYQMDQSETITTKTVRPSLIMGA